MRSKNGSHSKYLSLLLSESKKIRDERDNKVKTLSVSETLSVCIKGRSHGLNQKLKIQEKNLTMSDEQQRQRYLENEIHKITLKMMEGEMVKKKYDVIHDMLRKEQVHYTRQQMELEEVMKYQQKELVKRYVRLT